MEWEFLKNLLVLISGAVVLGLVFERLRLNAMLGYLLAGTLLGPGAFGIVSEQESVEMIAELGVALLLFSIGLEFSVRRLLDLGKIALVGGTLQVVLTITLVAGFCMAIGLPVTTSIAIGAVIAPSSTACVLRLLRDRGELDSIRGRNALGILLLQDAALVPLVLVMTSIAGPATFSTIMVNIGTALGVAVMFVIGIWILSKSLLPALLGTSTKVKSRELFVLLAVAIFIGAAWAAHLMHLSPSLGAFAAGVLLAESPFATQIRADIGGVRILFVTLFFTSVGMQADLQWLSQYWYIAIGVTVLMMAAKAGIILGVLAMLRAPAGPAFATGIVLSQAGEFSFVLSGMALADSVISGYTFRLFVTASLASLLATPFLVALAPQIGRKYRAMFGGSEAEDAKSDPALKDVPIILVSALVSNRELEEDEVARSGDKIVLGKPVKLEKLVKAIEQSLAHKL